MLYMNRFNQKENSMTDTTNAPGTAPQEPVEGKKKTPKVKAAKPEGANGEEKISRPRLAKFPETDVITVMKPGSKARTAADRFNQYRTGMTVKEYIDTMTKEPWNRPASMVWADLRWDFDEKRGFIHIGPTVVDVPPPPPPKEKKAKKAKPEVVAGTEHQASA
jgi:hypothetical protein